MSRRVRLVLVCEDNQHEAFARRFLRRTGWRRREVRLLKAQRAGGAAEQFVRETFAREVHALRPTHVSSVLVAMVDGDHVGVDGRVAELQRECEAHGVAAPTEQDPIFVLVPTRAIETWLAYLSGQDVDETRAYPHLQRERECSEQVDALFAMCERDALREPVPPSLRSACAVYERLKAARRRLVA